MQNNHDNVIPLKLRLRLEYSLSIQINFLQIFSVLLYFVHICLYLVHMSLFQGNLILKFVLAF